MEHTPVQLFYWAKRVLIHSGKEIVASIRSAPDNPLQVAVTGAIFRLRTNLLSGIDLSTSLNLFTKSKGFRYGCSSFTVVGAMHLMEIAVVHSIGFGAYLTGKFAFIIGSTDSSRRRVEGRSKKAAWQYRVYLDGFLTSPPLRAAVGLWNIVRSSLSTLGTLQLISGMISAITEEPLLDWGNSALFTNTWRYALGLLRPGRVMRILTCIYQYPDIWFFYLPTGFLLYMTYTIFTLKKKGNVSITVNNVVNIAGTEVEVKTKKTIDWGEQVILLGEETGFANSVHLAQHRAHDISSFGPVGIARLFTDAGPFEPLPLLSCPPPYNQRYWRVLSYATVGPVILIWSISKATHLIASVLYLPYYKRKGRLSIPERSVPSFEYKGYGYREDDGIWYNTVKFLMDHIVTAWRVELEPTPPPPFSRHPRRPRKRFELDEFDDWPDDPPPTSLADIEVEDYLPAVYRKYPSLIGADPAPILYDEEVPLTRRTTPPHPGPDHLTPGEHESLILTADEKCKRLCMGKEPHLPECPKVKKGITVFAMESGGSLTARPVISDSTSVRATGNLKEYSLIGRPNVTEEDIKNIASAARISETASNIYSTLLARGPSHSHIEGTSFNIDISRYLSTNFDRYEGKFTFVGELNGIKSLGKVNRAHDVPMIPQTDNFHCLNWLKVYFPEWHEDVKKLTKNPPTPMREIKEMMKYQLRASKLVPDDTASPIYPTHSERSFCLEYLLRATGCSKLRFKPKELPEILPEDFKRQWKKFPGYETKVLYGYQTKLDAFPFSKELARHRLINLESRKPMPDHYWASIPVPKGGTRKSDPNQARCRAAVCPEFWYNICVYRMLAHWVEFMEQTKGNGKFLMFRGEWDVRISRLVEVGEDWIKRTSDIRDHGASLSPWHFTLIKEYFHIVLESNPGFPDIHRCIDYLIDETCNAKIVLTRKTGGQVLSTSSGLKDGIQFTNWFDTLATHLNFALCAWRVGHSPTFLSEQSQIFAHLGPDLMGVALSVVFETHGDNDARCYHPLLAKYFAPRVVGPWLMEVGMELKPDECAESDNIRDLDIMGYRPAQVKDKYRHHWVWVRKPQDIWKSLVYPSIFVDPDFEEWPEPSFSYILGIIQCCYLMGFFNLSLRNALRNYYEQVMADFEYDVNRGTQLSDITVPRRTRLHEKMIELTGDEESVSRLLSHGTIPDDDFIFTLVTGKKRLGEIVPYVRDTDQYYKRKSRDFMASPEGAEHISTRLFFTDAEVAETHLVPLGEPKRFGSRQDRVPGILPLDPNSFARQPARQAQDEKKSRDYVLEQWREYDRRVATNPHAPIPVWPRPGILWSEPTVATFDSTQPSTSIHPVIDPNNNNTDRVTPTLTATVQAAILSAATGGASGFVVPRPSYLVDWTLWYGWSLERYIHPAPAPTINLQWMQILYELGVSDFGSHVKWLNHGWFRLEPAVIYSYFIGQHLPTLIPNWFYVWFGPALRAKTYNSFTGYSLALLEEELIMGDSDIRRAAFIAFEFLLYMSMLGVSVSSVLARSLAAYFHWNNRGPLWKRMLRHIAYNIIGCLAPQLLIRGLCWAWGCPFWATDSPYAINIRGIEYITGLPVSTQEQAVAQLFPKEILPPHLQQYGVQL